MAIELKEGQYFGHYVKSQENDFFACSMTRYEPGVFIPKHYHENNYVSILVSGHYSEKNKTGDTILGAGDIIFRPAHYDHANRFQSHGGTCFNIEFKQNWKYPLDFELELPRTSMLYKSGTFHSLYKLLYCFNQNDLADLQGELVLDWLFEINQVPLRSSLPWIEKVKSILENEVTVHHTLHTIAGRVCIHPVYLAGAFKRKTGYTLGEYQLRARMRRAVQLLLTSRLPISEIAFMTGFYDAAHFIKTFQTVYTTTPHKFRSALKS